LSSGLLIPPDSVHADCKKPHGQQPLASSSGDVLIGGELICELSRHKGSKTKPAIAISTPRVRGRKVDLRIKYPIKKQ